MHQQRRSAAAPATAGVPKRPRRRPSGPFLAAVRFVDGSRNVYEVSNAKSAEEARAMILDELSDVVAAMIVVR